MLNIILVFTGGGLGAVLRYLLGIFIKNVNFLPAVPETLWVNIIGSFLIGIFAVLFVGKNGIYHQLFLFFVCGFCGGFTTFSSFSAETLKFLQSQMYIQACLYIIASVCICILCTFIGGYIAKYFV